MSIKYHKKINMSMTLFKDLEINLLRFIVYKY